MGKIKSFYDDDEWKAKKVFRKLEKKQDLAKKSPETYKKRVITKTNYITKINPQVVIKITSSSNNYGGLKAHIRYISRNGKLEVVTSEGEVFHDKKDIDNIMDAFNQYYKIPTEDDLFSNHKKEKRETLNIVFSMKDYANASTEKIREAAMKTISEKYPNNFFVIAMHNDTDNPHCHLCVKTVSNDGRTRIAPSKKDLDQLRKEFALNLNTLGVEATTKIYRKYNLETGEEIDKKLFIKNGLPKSTFPAHKPHHYQVIDFGKAHYKFDIKNKNSFYVRYRTSKGKDVEIWSNDLERVIKENNVKIGDYCRFAPVKQEAVESQITDKAMGETATKTIYKKIWDVSIEGKAEKILNPLSKTKSAEFKLVKKERPIQPEESIVIGKTSQSGLKREKEKSQRQIEKTGNELLADLE